MVQFSKRFMAPVYNVVVATRKSTKMDKILTKVFDEELSIFWTVFNFVKENPTTILVGHISKSEVFVNLEFSFLKHGFTVLQQMKETEMLLLSEIVDVQTSSKSLKTFFSRDYEIFEWDDWTCQNLLYDFLFCDFIEPWTSESNDENSRDPDIFPFDSNVRNLTK